MPDFTYRTRVAFVDTDASGRIHFTAMLRYFEAAEQEFIRSLRLNYRDTLQEIGFPRVHAECDYRSAVVFDDELEVTVQVRRVGNSSYTLGFTVTNGQTVAAAGNLVVVSFDRRQNRAMPLPDALREALKSAQSVS